MNLILFLSLHMVCVETLAMKHEMRNKSYNYKYLSSCMVEPYVRPCVCFYSKNWARIYNL